MTKINVEGMTCQSCVKHVKSAIESFDGVKNVNVELENNLARFDIEDSNINLDDIILKVNDAGYKASK